MCACVKTLEIIVKESILRASLGYIRKEQHGFMPKRSTSTNLVRFVAECVNCMDQGLQVDCIYTDLRAAFDSISHDILLQKLQRLGLSQSIVAWLNSYLRNRKYRVKFREHTSRPFFWYFWSSPGQQSGTFAVHSIHKRRMLSSS